MRPEGGALPPKALEQAAEWMMRRQQGSSREQDAQWQQWCDAAPENQLAWERAERLLALAAQIPPPLAQAALQRPPSPRRRALLRGLGALMVAPVGGWLAWRAFDEAAWNAGVRIATGERRQHRLADGSVLHLDTDSAVDIAFGDRERLLRLRRGQVWVETAPDPARPARPFVLASAAGRMQALGTRFNAWQSADSTRLSVAEGAVRVSLAKSAQQIVVHAGQQLRFSAQAAMDITASHPAVDAWRSGMLVADAMPLRTLLEHLQRYQGGWITCEETIASRPVSGAFPLDDPERSIALLARTQGLQVIRSPWWIRLRARGG